MTEPREPCAHPCDLPLLFRDAIDDARRAHDEVARAAGVHPKALSRALRPGAHMSQTMATRLCVALGLEVRLVVRKKS